MTHGDLGIFDHETYAELDLTLGKNEQVNKNKAIFKNNIFKIKNEANKLRW